MFSKHYQSELTYLRQLGRELEDANPALAGWFAAQGGDPDVARLLEGFAFLTARIRERIDDAVPEVIHALAEMVLPQAIRPLPACSVVEFRPRGTALRGLHRLPEGTEVGARPIDGTACLFRTTVPVDLLPLSLTRTRYDPALAERPAIALGFEGTAGAGALLQATPGLRLFLHGPVGLTTTVYLWLLRHLARVEVRGASGATVHLGAASVRPAGLDRAQPMLPWPELAPDGLRVMQEYFTLVPKLLFVDLVGLSELPPDALGDAFEIVLRFDRPPRLPERPGDGLFRLFCAPVINLFAAGADPVLRDRRQHEHLLRASRLDPRHMEVYRVERVVGLRAQRRGRREYTPFYSFRHAARRPEEQAFFCTRRARSPIDGGVDTYLSVRSGTDLEPDGDGETLSVDLLCTNRSLPTELRAGDLDRPTPRSPTVASFRNLVHVTRPVRPPLGSDLTWRLIAHLALNVRTLTDAESLRALLGLYNVQGEADEPLGQRNARRIASIRSVEARPARKVVERVAVRGQRIRIEVDRAAFASDGDAFAFGAALDALFASETPLNTFHELVVRLHPTGVELAWPGRLGEQPVL
ncbi:MAG: type VI secretion system baseplate subunit TssF [Sandaracinaceae bacterium]